MKVVGDFFALKENVNEMCKEKGGSVLMNDR